MSRNETTEQKQPASFASDVRAELIALPIKNNCCRKALVMGLLIGAEPGEGPVWKVRFHDPAVSAFAGELFEKQFGKHVEPTVSGACGHRYFDYPVTAPTARKMLTALHIPGNPLSGIIEPKCENCQNAFLRGAFLSCGTVSDPHKSFHAEFRAPDQTVADALKGFLEEFGFSVRTVRRERGVGVYTKNSQTVEDVITFAGATRNLFAVINSRIERDLRNNENRATNCVAKNIEKTIAASSRQMDAINKLMEEGRLEGLPETLRQTALLRYRNPDATLDELAGMHDPVITKSGLNHRISRILELAEEN